MSFVKQELTQCSMINNALYQHVIFYWAQNTDVWIKNKGIGHLENFDDVHGKVIMKHNISEQIFMLNNVCCLAFNQLLVAAINGICCMFWSIGGLTLEN